MRLWHCYPTLSASMPFQMALDEILFRRFIARPGEPPMMRFYFSSEPWLSVGYSDFGPFPSGIKICKRITGGGRVNHGEDFLFSLIAHRKDDESFNSVRVSYWKIHEAVKLAFETSGSKPRFYRCDEKLPRAGECFIHPIATDLELDGKKVAGGAQKRSMGVMLHQESIQLSKGFDPFEFSNQLRAGLEQTFSVKIEDAVCDPETLSEAKILAAEKYE